MHIALFTDFHPDTLGGVQTAQRALCDGLRGRGHRVSVFTAPAPGSGDSDDTIPLRTVPLSMNNGLPVVLPTRANRRLLDAAFAERGPVDVVHTLTTYGVGIAGVRAARRHGVPVVQSMQSRDDTMIEKYSPSPYFAALTMRMLHGWFVPLRGDQRHDGDGRTARLAWRPLLAQAQSADRVVVPTEHFARRLAARGVDRPIHVVSNGIDDALLDRVRRAERAAPATGAPLRVLWCGRFSAEKRPLEAIEAVRLTEHCTLDVYGNGPLADQVGAAADAAGERVRLHGAVTQAEILAAMRAHDVLLLTSDCDTQGMVLLEAVATGLPIVFCDPELSETVPEGGGVRTGDPTVRAFADVLGALATDRARLGAMREVLAASGDEPRQSRHLDRLLSVYQDAVAVTGRGVSRRTGG
ncbi:MULTISPECIES: glycosyltransferase [unclassified Nocardia]|uniref:glycosyltransferase n=1 Tax=unclassified Nocardia TaxID=2637762 RepID=UPI0033BC1F58